jgi:hypothetical protein
MNDFWDDMGGAFAKESCLDSYLGGRKLEGPQYTSVRNLTDAVRQATALPLPVDAGTRVSFVSNIGSVLSYEDIPASKVEGTVVTVKTGAGNMTAMDERVFVLWDDGKFRSILAEHLRPAGVTSKRGSAVRMVVADLGDISSFFTASSGGRDELVHKATKDLWAFHQDGGQYVIERLFSDTGEPLKV